MGPLLGSPVLSVLVLEVEGGKWLTGSEFVSVFRQIVLEYLDRNMVKADRVLPVEYLHVRLKEHRLRCEAGQSAEVSLARLDVELNGGR